MSSRKVAIYVKFKLLKREVVSMSKHNQVKFSQNRIRFPNFELMSILMVFLPPTNKLILHPFTSIF